MKKQVDVKKDWTGNKKTAFVGIGASNHSDKERQSEDFYATPPSAISITMVQRNENCLQEEVITTIDTS